MYKFAFAFLILFCLSCGEKSDNKDCSHDNSYEVHKTQHKEDDGHDHGDEIDAHDIENDSRSESETLQTTIFSQKNEYFIEYNPLIKNESSTFTIHITRLEDYKPYKKGVVSVEINSDSQFADKPPVAGIFHVNFTPKTVGQFKAKFYFETNSELDFVTHELEVFENDEDYHAYDKESVEKFGTIHFSKEQAWNTDFMIKKIATKPFASVITTSGEMLAMPGEKQNIAAKSSGILLFAKKNLVQGSKVNKGQLLFTISSKNMANDEIGLKYSEIKNDYLLSKSEYERHKKLYSENIISAKKFKRSESKYKTDSTTFHSFSKNASSKGVNIYSPLSGYIHELMISEGQYVDLGQLLATISTNKIMLLRADLPQQYYYKLNQIETANFRPAYSSKIYTIDELNGHLLAKGASVAENNHYMPIFFQVQNDGSLLEGAFAEFYLLTKKTLNSLSVPNSAIIEEQGSHYIFIQKGGESYLKQIVKLGESNGLEIEILLGLNSGDWVITEGAMIVKTSSMQSGDGEAHAGHNH